MEYARIFVRDMFNANQMENADWKVKKNRLKEKKELEWMRGISRTEACYGFIFQTADNKGKVEIEVEESTELSDSGFDS